MSSGFSSKQAQAELAQWLQELRLEKRRAELQKNVSSAMADGVLVAEVVHSVYPKLVQLHNYYETHSTQGRKTNWLLLNKKVLKHIRCEATDSDIETFIKRQSQDDALLFLRNLKTRLPAYEPLYLSGQYEVKQPSKRLSSHPRTDQTQSRLATITPPPPPSESSHRSNSVSSLSSSSSMKASQNKVSERRSSAIMSEKILAAKKKSTDSARRRASLLTPRDMDQMYSSLSTKIRSSSISMAQKSEELDQQSAIMDAKFAALRKQNQEDILKQDKKLSLARNEERDILKGQEVFGVDEKVFNYLEDPKRAVELKEQLKEEYRRASVALNKYQHNYYEEDENFNYAPAAESSGYGQSSYVPYTPPTGGNSIRKASMSVIENTFGKDDSPSVTSSISNVSSNSNTPNSKSVRSPSILYSKSFNTPMNKLKESLHATAVNSAVPNVTSSNDTPPPPLPIPSSSIPFVSPGGGVSSLSGEESSDGGEDSSSDEDDDDMPPPPPPKTTSSENHVVTHIRHFSEEYKCHYYTRVSDSGGESDWVPPTIGIVQCIDESTGKTFYTQSSTGKTAWDLNGF